MCVYPFIILDIMNNLIVINNNNDNDNDDDDIVLFKQIWILREPLFKRTFCLKRGWCVNGT